MNSFGLRSALYRSRCQALDELPAHGQIEKDDGDSRQGEDREDLGPVGYVLAEKPRYPEKERFRAVVAYEDQGEPEVVPERDEVVDTDRREGRFDHRHDDSGVDARAARSVNDCSLGQVVGNVADELGEYEHRDGQSHGEIDRIQAEEGIEEPQRLDHLEELDAAYLDGEHHARDEEEIDETGFRVLPVDDRVRGERPEQQDEGDRADGDEEAVLEIDEEIALAQDGRIAFEVPLPGKAEGILVDVQLEFERIYDHRPQGEQDYQRPQSKKYMRSEVPVFMSERCRACHVCLLQFFSVRVARRMSTAPTISMKKVLVAIAAPRPGLGMPTGCWPAMPTR